MSSYIAHSKDFHTLTTALSKSINLDPLSKSLHYGSPRFRSILIPRLSATLVFPMFSIRKNMLDAGEYAAMPKGLKFRILSAFWLTAIGFVWILISAGMITFAD
ncbi:hypothetical protein [Pseudomonas sp. UFMG81]|uniref:hypothetical protein n=1 Tax=Pseudomonas sp. UFMG81 TaxID=2745936 RepID=UPI0018908FAE|nr:hypothetical protein [Pseudomonas sp. UFMG81]